MTESVLHEKISEKKINKEILAEEVINKPDLLLEVLEGLNTDKADIKFGCDKILRIISEKNPELLYSKMDFFINNLDCENTFIKIGAIYVLARLAGVDSNNRFDEIFEKYFSSIPGPTLMIAANVIAGAAKIASAKPKLTERITKELLKVESAQYKTDECRNIAIGKTIESFDKFFNKIENKEPVIKLIRKQLTNSRNATKKKAEKFAKKFKI